jgi:integrase
MALRIAEHTKGAFGKPVNMHLFRDCAATSIALGDAEHVRIAAAVLGHRSFATTERHYNLARSAEAAADYHSYLDRFRQEA